MIETERLLLRPFKESDYKDLYEYLHEPQVHCFYSMRVNTLEDAKKECIERSKDPSGLYFAIVLKSENKVIGEVFTHPESTDPESQRFDTYCPCWMLNKAYQRHGYMSEAAIAFISHIFSLPNAHRIFCYTEDYNIPTQKQLEKLGFRQEGLFKDFVAFIDDENGNPIYESTYQYALLKEEWNPGNFNNGRK